MTVAVFGATGKTGRYLVPALIAEGCPVLAIGRDPVKLSALDARCRTAVQDLENPDALAALLAEAQTVVSLAHARHAETILAALPTACRRVVLTGSVRRFTALPDPAADAVRRAEAAFEASGRPGVVLHPSMIFGAPEERNVNRILDRVAAWPAHLPLVVPLPGGGRHRVQPIYYEDVVAAYVAAVLRPEAPGESIVLAGLAPLTYADMVRACAMVCGRRARILPVPNVALRAGARLLAALGRVPPLSPAEIRRAGEDKAFDVKPMIARLGVRPRLFEAGLAEVKVRRARGLADVTANRHHDQ